jgi:hypothetical protein
MSNELPSFSILDNRTTELQNKVQQIMGVCDLIAHAADPAVCRDGLDDDSIRHAALLAREALSEVASDLADLLAPGPGQAEPPAA